MPSSWTRLWISVVPIAPGTAWLTAWPTGSPPYSISQQTGSSRHEHAVRRRLAVKEWRQNAGDHEPRHRPGPQHHHDADKDSVAHATAP